jgi:hypothetical protein
MAAVPIDCRRPTNGATVPAMSSVRVRLRIERHIRENAQDLPRAERGFSCVPSMIDSLEVQVPYPA